jgi:serine/threonine protein kinase
MRGAVVFDHGNGECEMADKKIGKYEIIDRVGSGDMGTVYKAKDRLGRFVAIKVISSDRKVTEEFKTRFLSEAQASAGLSHPNIVGIVDIDEEKDLLYTVMELLEGSDLKKLAADKTDVPVEDKIHAMMQAADALQHAHEKNVIHGNLKPGKVVLQKDGTTKLVDFGGGRVAATTPGGLAASSPATPTRSRTSTRSVPFSTKPSAARRRLPATIRSSSPSRSRAASRSPWPKWSPDCPPTSSRSSRRR